MLEHIWRSIHSPDYFPNVLEWMLHILFSPFMMIMCLMVGALTGMVMFWGVVVLFVVIITVSVATQPSLAH